MAESGADFSPCGAAFMIDIATELSRHGVADYWDDVDRFARNHIIECQITDYENFAGHR